MRSIPTDSTAGYAKPASKIMFGGGKRINRNVEGNKSEVHQYQDGTVENVLNYQIV
jgi:hypothetical protein